MRTRPRNYLRVGEKLRYRGTYVDYWTCVHFATGVCFGYLLARTGISFHGGFGVATIAFVLWEVFEPSFHRLIGRQFPEKLSNQIIDVVSGLSGYFIGFALASPDALFALLLDLLDFLAG